MIIKGKKYDYEFVLDKDSRHIKVVLLKELPEDGYEVLDEGFCSIGEYDAEVNKK